MAVAVQRRLMTMIFRFPSKARVTMMAVASKGTDL